MLQDLRYAVRMLGRSPGLSAAVILSMALGIGANTAIFSLIHTLLLRPLPVAAPEELVEPISWLPQSDSPRANAFAWKHYTHFRDHARAFASLLAQSPVRLAVGDAGATETIDAEFIVGSFFPALGLRPALGRLLDPDDDRADASAAAVISWEYWRRHFDTDAGVLGRTLLLNGSPATIVGVTPRAFFGLRVGLSPDIWVPMAMEPRTQRPSHLSDGSLPVQVMGRLKPGVLREQAEAEMQVLDRYRIEDLARRAPFWRNVQLTIEPATAGLAGPRDLFAGPLVMLMAVVAVLLLIACANVAALLLARASARQREIAVRVAIGAGRGRLVRQLLTESLLLSAIGGGLGIVFAVVGGNLLVRTLLSGRLPPGFPPSFDIQVQPEWTVLLFTAAAVLVTGVFSGLAPAVHAWSTAPMAALRTTMAAGEAPRRRRFGYGLVAAQVGLSTVLLSTAGLLIGHVTNLKNVDTGVDRRRVMLVTLDPATSGYERQQLFLPYRMLIERLAAMPSIEAATVSAVTPIQGPGAARMIDVPGFQESPEARKFIPLNFVGPRYFETFGTRMMAGRDFRFDDIGRPRVAIVNQAMARHYFPGNTPIGKRFTFTGREGEYEIVGLVADAKYQELTDVPPLTIYVHAFQEPRMFADRLSIRTRVAETAVAAEVRRVVQDVLKPGAVANVTTLDAQMDASIVIERTVARLSVFFGVLGAFLAALGLYGLLAYTVARRTREIGVRMALGASRGDVVRLVLGGTAMLVAAGIVIGAPAAFWGRRIAAQALRNFTADAPLPIALAIAQIALVALAAAYLPARRAASVDPSVALRQD
jgi:putative ABC transport system permease protein